MKFSITFFPLTNTFAKLLSANVSEFGILTTTVCLMSSNHLGKVWVRAEKATSFTPTEDILPSSCGIIVKVRTGIRLLYSLLELLFKWSKCCTIMEQIVNLEPCGHKQTNLCLCLTHSFLHWHLTPLLNELSSAEQLHISIIWDCGFFLHTHMT